MRPIYLAATALFAIVAAPAHAALTVWTSTLLGANEVPAVPSTATGTGVFVFDDATNLISLSIDVDGLSSGLADGHWHFPGLPGFNGPVVVGFPDLPLGETSFSYDVVLDLLADATYRPAFLAANGGSAAAARDALIDGFNSNTVYTNIHSINFRSGEIRGQVEVPAPAALALFGVGVMALGLARRR